MLLRIAIFAFALLSVAPAHAAKKVALLIGNATYTSATATLRNPPNDVAAMKSMLEAAEFDVTVVSNVTRVEMSEALDIFSEKAHGADVGMVYYSGHGIELDGTNYLVPVDAQLKSDRSAKYEAVTLDDVIAAVSGATTLKLILLDACRDNPFKNSMRRVATKGAPTRGLARVDTSDNNLLIGYATSPGSVASDGEGNNSPYAQALVRHLTRPGLEIESALRAVAKEVHGRTGGEQVPFKTGSLFETVMLSPHASGQAQVDAMPAVVFSPATSTAADTNACEGEHVSWNAVKTTQSFTRLTEHIEKFAMCETSERAKTRLALLRAKSPYLSATQPVRDLPYNYPPVTLEEALQLDDPFSENFDPLTLAAVVERAIVRGDKSFLNEMIRNGSNWSSHFQSAMKDRLQNRGIYESSGTSNNFTGTHNALRTIFGTEPG